MINFTTPYKNDYTTPIKDDKKEFFTTKYITTQANNVISGKDRPKNFKFKSRLVSK